MREGSLIRPHYILGWEIVASVKCPKCAAPVTFDTGTKFVKCSYCDSQIFIDRSGAGFYYVVPFAVAEPDAIGFFRRWAAG